MHLFADISSHGFGHLAISAPILNRLAECLPGLRLTIRTGLPPRKLAERVHVPHTLIPQSSDFGFTMIDTMRVDVRASADAYRAAHRDWPRRVADEATLVQTLAPDLVFSNVSYLPLAGAALAGIPAFAIGPLNWADLFAHYYAGEAWSRPIHAEMLAAYRSARAFLRITPGMPMPDLAQNLVEIGPVSIAGKPQALGEPGMRNIVIAMGGIDHRLPLENWPRLPGIRWIVPRAWQCVHPDAVDMESLGIAFTDLLASVDAVITKPGYGTFTEAACNGTPVLYQRREDWPEQACLIDWLNENGRCRQVPAARLGDGELRADLDALWAMPPRPRPAADGVRQAAELIAAGIRNASAARPPRTPAGP